MKQRIDMDSYRLAYQGGPGCHSERAGKLLLEGRFVGCPQASFADAADALVARQADLVIVPVFNSTTGPITEALAKTGNFAVLDEITLRIDHYLLAICGARRRDIKVVWAQPQVALQCTRWIRNSGVEVQGIDDGARAAPGVQGKKLHGIGVLGPFDIGAVTGLRPLEGPIQDRADNRTTFHLLCRSDAIPAYRSDNQTDSMPKQPESLGAKT